MVAELDRRSAALESGEDKGYTLEESMAHLKQILRGMANNVKISSRAQKDLTESYEWYEEQSIGLGDRFSKKIIYSDINLIANDPLFTKH